MSSEDKLGPPETTESGLAETQLDWTVRREQVLAKLGQDVTIDDELSRSLYGPDVPPLADGTFSDQDDYALTQDLGRKQLFSEDEQPLESDKNGRFLFSRLVGQGGAGIVYRATDQDIGRDVAVKRFRVEGEGARGACAHEARITGAIDHPGVPPIYDVGKDEEGRYYIVMRYLQGQTLDQLITKLRDGDEEAHRNYNFCARADLVIQLLRILAAAHENGVVHRDLKPSNVLVAPHGEITLMDWGIAFNQREENTKGTLCGTPAYMAPEQARMEAVDHRADVFSAGAILYELLSLQRAAPPELSIDALMDLILTYDPPPVDRLPHPTSGECALRVQDRGSSSHMPERR